MYFHSSRLIIVNILLATASHAESWAGWGGGVSNSRWAVNNTKIGIATIATLAESCRQDYKYGVSATPVTFGNIVYYPTWDGLFVALDYVTCKVQWQLNVTNLIFQYAPPGIGYESQQMAPVSRTSPQIDDNIL